MREGARGRIEGGAAGLIRPLMVLGFLAIAVTGAAAQTGGIEVTVTDVDGSPLPGATVTISHDSGSVKTTAELTDRIGRADFPVLFPGRGYTIVVAFPGLTTIRYDALRVRINESLDIHVRMSGEFEEQVTVRAEADVIELDKTESSTRFRDSFIADLPVAGRFYQNILTMAPGVQDADGDGNPNVHGSRSRDFQAILSGVSNVDPLTGQWLSRINPNSIEEIEIITAGAGVEFGRAQGGFARIIQKQGSNSHEGLFEFYWQTSLLDGNGADDLSVLPDRKFDTIQPMFQFTGPLVRDRLWYRASFEKRDREDPVDVLSGIEIYERDTETRDGQVTWQASPRTKLALRYRSDPLEDRNFGISNRLPPESSLRHDRTVQTYSLTWTAPYSPKVLVETTVAWQDVKNGLGPSVRGAINACVPNSNRRLLREAQCVDLATGHISGSYYRTVSDHRQRLTLKTQANVYAGRFLGAIHKFKVGFHVENERYFRELTRRPNIAYREIEMDVTDDLGQQHEEAFGIALTRISVPQTDAVRATGTNWALYAEDQLKPLQNLTLTVGARLDREELYSEGREPFDPSAELHAFEEYVAQGPNEEAQDLLANEWPGYFTGYAGIGSFDTGLRNVLCADVPLDTIGNCMVDVSESILKQNHVSLLRKRREKMMDLSNSNVSPFLAVGWAPGGNGKTAIKATAGRHYNNIPLMIPLQELEPTVTDVQYRVKLDTQATSLEGSISPTVNTRTVARDLRTPYQDEFTFKIERELWAETAVSLTWIDRRYRDQIQDININLDIGDYGRCIIQYALDPFPHVPAVGGGEGSGVMLTDAFTGEVYEDTDPGPGDGRLDDCSGIYVFVPVPNPGGDDFGHDWVAVQRPDGITDLYAQNPFWGELFLVGNYNRIDYEAIVLELVRRQYRSWEMNGSYTRSRAEGDGEDFFQRLGDDPSLRDDVQGYQSYDQLHVVKLNATTITPWGIRLGTSVTWQSGLPYSLLWHRVSFDTAPPTTSAFGTFGARERQTYFTGARNDQRNRSYWNVDLKATREFRIGRHANLQLSAEIFNLLDDGTYMIYNPFFERGQQVNGNNEAFRRFGRRWQLGTKITF